MSLSAGYLRADAQSIQLSYHMLFSSDILCWNTWSFYIFLYSLSLSLFFSPSSCLWHSRKNFNNFQRTFPTGFTFIGIHGSHWSFRRLPHGLLCWIGFRELRRIWQGRLGGRGRRFLGRHSCSLIGHGACGDPSLTAALAIGSLPATRRVLLLSVLVLPTVTLVFVLANVPVVLETERKALETIGRANHYSLLTQQ